MVIIEILLLSSLKMNVGCEINQPQNTPDKLTSCYGTDHAVNTKTIHLILKINWVLLGLESTCSQASRVQNQSSIFYGHAEKTS